MKITKEDLQQIIKEELEKSLKEGGYREGTIRYTDLLAINEVLKEYGYALRQPLNGPLKLINI
tara:strand:+ start:622 stop:810 length:189 start_codon:yes stop_codon:yes gene_type:complete